MKLWDVDLEREEKMAERMTVKPISVQPPRFVKNDDGSLTVQWVYPPE